MRLRTFLFWLPVAVVACVAQTLGAAEKAAFVPGNETGEAIATLNTVLNL